MQKRPGAWILGIVIALSYLGLIREAITDPENWVLPVSLVGFAVVGFLILLRLPGHLIGRLVVAPVLFVGSSFWLLLLAEDASAPMGLRVGAELGTLVLWYQLFASSGLLVVYFPRGVVTSRIERLARLAVVSTTASVAMASLTSPGRLEVTGQPNPFALDLPGPLTAWLDSDQSLFLFVAAYLVAFGSLILRWRSSEGVDRLQFRWFGLGVVAFVIGVLASSMSATGSLLNMASTAVGLLSLPICIGVAVTRYRLYEIDRLVSRTITYAIVVGVLGLVFLGIVTVATGLIPAQNQLVVAVATLVVTATFNRFRLRVQRRVDRRFDRSRYDAERVVAEFARHLSDNTDSQVIAAGLAWTVGAALRPTTVDIWLRDPVSPLPIGLSPRR